MMPAHELLEKDLNELIYGEPMFPIVHNVNAAVNDDGSVVCSFLTEQVSSTVRWSESVETLVANGVEKFVEVGPGKVLSGLVRQINRDVQCFNVDNSVNLSNTKVTI